MDDQWDCFTVCLCRGEDGQIVGKVETHNNGAFDLDWLERLVNEATAAYSRRRKEHDSGSS